MRPRDIAVIIGLAAAIAASVLLFVHGSGDPAGDTAPVATGGPPVAPDSERDDVRTQPDAVAVATADPTSDATTGRTGAATDGPRPTSGVIEGRVSMAVDLLGKVATFHVRVVELVNPSSTSDDHVAYDRVNPKAFPVPSDHTPRFRVEDIPFSRFGYRVELIASGCNGSSQIVRIAEEQPFVEVQLALTPPVPFALRLRDQHANPHADWRLELRPIGDPPGRSMAVAVTNHFGTAVLETLVQGEYVVWHQGHELETIRVEPTASVVRGRPIASQSATIIVPVGRQLRVETFGPAGIGIEGVPLTLYKTDTTQNRRHEAVTGFGGVHVFDHLEDGRYQLDVAADGMQRTSRTLRVPEDVDEPLKVVLIPLR